MAGLPESLLGHEIVVEPYLGASGTGPRFGPPTAVRCYIDPGARRTQRGAETRTATGPATIYCQLDAPITPESRVTVDGRRVEVLAVNRYDGGGLPTPNHLQVEVQ